jgi:hypothetical protein
LSGTDQRWSTDRAGQAVRGATRLEIRLVTSSATGEGIPKALSGTYVRCYRFGNPPHYFGGYEFGEEEMRLMGVIGPMGQISLVCSNSGERGCAGGVRVCIPPGTRKPVRRSGNIGDFAF